MAEVIGKTAVMQTLQHKLSHADRSTARRDLARGLPVQAERVGMMLEEAGAAADAGSDH